MDPALTRTKAHVLFGELYSKSRPPELQEKVEAAIQGVSDIFVRIRKIQEIDEQFERSRKPSRPEPVQRSRRGGGGGTGTGPSAIANRPKAPAANSGGFLSFIFGKSDLAAWGEKTGTIVTGLFGLNQHLSSQVQHSFSAVNEQQIVELLKAMRFFIQKGWERFPPAKYNSVVTAYQFFEEYLKVELLFRKQEIVSTILTQTIKMQVLYAQLLQFEGFADFFRGDFVEFLKDDKDYGAVSSELLAGIESLLGFETRRPRLSDCILSLYAVDRKRLFNWTELITELKVGAPVTDRYRAPEKIQQVIQQRQDRLQNEIEFRKRSIAEIAYIRETYFKIDERGKANVDFIQDIARDVLMRSSSEQRTSAEYLRASISEPHRLLAILLKDVDVNFIQILSGSVHVHQQGAPTEVIIFRPAVFKAELDLLNELQQDMAEFLKKFKNTALSFAMYLAATKGEAKDQVSQGFRPLAMKSCQLFSSLQSKLRTVLVAHRETLEKEATGHLKEAVQRTRSIPIEAISAEQRFLPWSDAVVADSSRFSQKTVLDVLDDMVRCLYNYLYIYRDTSLLQTLNSVPRLKSEVGLLEKKLLQYGSG
jgi:hypothetical protein